MQADAREAEGDGREAGQGCCPLPRPPNLRQETPAPGQEAFGFKVSLIIWIPPVSLIHESGSGAGSYLIRIYAQSTCIRRVQSCAWRLQKY